jgi:hypothetical protein
MSDGRRWSDYGGVRYLTDAWRMLASGGHHGLMYRSAMAAREAARLNAEWAMQERERYIEAVQKNQPAGVGSGWIGPVLAALGEHIRRLEDENRELRRALDAQNPGAAGADGPERDLDGRGGRGSQEGDHAGLPGVE